MARKILTQEEIIKACPGMKGFVCDGATDYKRVAKLVGTTNKDMIWDIINCFEKEAEESDSAKALAKAFGYK